MDSAGVEIIEVYQQFSFWAVVGVAVGVFGFICAIASLQIGLQEDDDGYYLMAVFFAVCAILLMLYSAPRVYQRGFRARVDNITAWAEISINYTMTDLDDNGVFTFRER